MPDAPRQPEPRPCPSCGKGTEADAEEYPFCSRRCRLIDLGAWMDERYRIAQRDPDEDS